MPFDVVFDIAYDQQRVLLEHSKLQGVGDADLFRNRFLARASHPLEQVSSRLCSLPTLFAFLSRQARASNFRPRSAGDTRRNSVVLFSFPEGAVAILFVICEILLPMFFRISPNYPTGQSRVWRF